MWSSPYNRQAGRLCHQVPNGLWIYILWIWSGLPSQHLSQGSGLPEFFVQSLSKEETSNRKLSRKYARIRLQFQIISFKELLHIILSYCYCYHQFLERLGFEGSLKIPVNWKKSLTFDNWNTITNSHSRIDQSNRSLPCSWGLVPAPLSLA